MNKSNRKTPIISPEPDTSFYRLVEDFSITVKGYLIVVPAGFIFDGGSVPKLAQPILYTPFDPTVLITALVHDWLYTCHRVSGGDKITRKTADKIQFELATQDGVPLRKRLIIYEGIRLGGRSHWKNKKKHQFYICKILSDNPDIDAKKKRPYYGISEKLGCNTTPHETTWFNPLEKNP